MISNFRQLEKDLKSYTKRTKNVRYSQDLLLVFLITGTISFTSWGAISNDVDLVRARSGVNSSITDMRQSFSRARSENKKLLEDANLELIQLMEQGDQVVKSPWSSWQFGVNTYIGENKGTYKGHGDKKPDQFYGRESKFSSLTNKKGSAIYGYGTTELSTENTIEKPSEIEVDATITPKSVNKTAPTFVLTPPTGGLPPFVPNIIPAPVRPGKPSSPEITIFDPINLTFNGTGFGQGKNPTTSQGNLTLENYSTYNTTAPVFIKYDASGRTMTGGNVDVTLDSGAAGTSLTPGTGPQGTFFISDAADHSVTINGDYDVTRASALGNGTLYFVSLNPYEVGRNKTTDGVYDFAGNLTLHGHNDPTSGNLLLGFEHQLLANGPGGGENFANVTGGNVTSILKNTGNINLADGYNIVGIQIDTEYSAGNESTHGFIKQPQTINDGTININSEQSIGIDYGYYYSAMPNTKLFIGDINVNGQNNYGVRMKDYHNNSATYYDLTNVTGNKSNGTAGVITVRGQKNVGFYTGQGMSTGDPLANVTDLNINVGGNSNIGFLRAGGTGVNSNAMVLDATRIGSNFNFLNDASNSALIRSDNHEVKLDKDITVGAIGDKNTLLQAGKTGTVRLGAGRTITSKLSDEFYGMTAGNFAATGKTAGATIINEGTLDIAGVKSIAMAVDAGNTGQNKGTITFNGENTSGIYNLGTFDQTSTGNLTINGKNNTSIYNTGTMTLDGTTTITGTDGSTGIYSSGGSLSNLGKGTVSITLNNTPTNSGIGVFADNGSNVVLDNAIVNVKDGSSAVVSYDTGTNVSLKNSTINYDGSGYALYAKDGTIDLTGSNITLAGKATGYEMDASGTLPITLTGVTITAMSDDVTVMSLRNVSKLNLSTLATDLGTLSGGVTVVDGTDPITGVTYDKYKLAAVDGLTAYNIDVDLDKKLGADNTKATTNDYQFTRRLAAQRAILNLKAGKTVDAVLSTAEEAAIGASSVVGLDISSSSYASSNAETGINLEASSTVNADRTDAGNGAVGLYTNYGKINTDASSTINVEKGANTVNDSGVGIYTVNGSEVDSKGTINVGGNKSIGILGVAYREDITTGTPIVNEFVSSTGVVAPGQGTSKVVNSGQINLDGNNATGIYVKNNNATGTNTTTTALNTGAGAINLTGNNSIGMLGDKATLTNDAKINLNGQESVGMYANNGSVILNDTNGVINLATSTVGLNPNVGIFTDDAATTIENKGKIIGGDNTYGIYSQGATVTTRNGSEIEVGESGVGIYSTGSAINLDNGSKIKVGGTEAVGVFVTGDSTIVGNADMTIGDSSFGYVVKPTSATTGTTLTTSATNPITLGNDAVYVYSADTLGTVTNNTVINSTGNNNYGIYSASNVQNNADINFGSGLGNVAIYTTDGATATNGVLGSATNPTITVSGSGMLGGTQVYGIGMAAGYYDGTVTRYTGKVVNHGTINVGQTGGIGMYAVGSGSEAVNYGDINLTGANSVGMYLDRGAIGTNWGTITTGPTASNGGIIGVVATNGAIIKNYGQIIIDGTDNKAVYLAHASSHYEDTDTATGTVGTITTTNGAEGVKRKTVSDTGKVVGGVQIITPPAVSSTVVNINGVPTPIVNVDTDATATNPSATIATVGATQVLDLATLGLTGTSTTEVLPGIGMYVDTSGVQFTNPIHNLGALTGLGRVDLIFGNEASKYTDSKVIQLGNNIIDPYNLALSSLTGASSLKIGLSSSNLTWLATGVQNPGTGLLDSVYLVKIPYTSFAVSGDTNTYNFLDGLEQSYVSSGNSRMSQLFSKLNSLNKNEAHILAQAVDQMKGHQYANVQQRINATGNKIDKEIDYLFDEWETKSKESNKIKLFGIYDQYNTDSAGIINWASDGYGVAYLHEDETVKLGDTTGWYAGAIHNRFRFKDMGGSKENTTMLKAGIFKSTAFDDNNSLNWTISGEGFVSRSEMDRRFWVVDDVFSASSNYTSYGLGLKNEISKTFRTSPKTSIKPYASLDMEYGRFSNISEKNGEVQLEVKGNDYYSIQPEIGMEFKYRTPFAKRSIFITKLNVAYENELGKIGDVRNQARVKGTTANWYDLRGEKEDRRGNVKTDLNIGIENGRVGFTLNAGYDTKGNNIRGGIGLRAIY